MVSGNIMILFASHIKISFVMPNSVRHDKIMTDNIRFDYIRLDKILILYSARYVTI